MALCVLLVVGEPAAMALWQAGIGGGQAAPLVVRREDARWVEGGLTAAGMSVLIL